ncbi:MAG: CsgG/HfaB family protein [Deltaproteobacteria bacterium]|nr:CsgG/HfaB family protein [Deltaproteobacteria bacterium]
MGKLTGARYLISATVTSFEENVSGKDAGFHLMGVSVGGDKAKTLTAKAIRGCVIEIAQYLECSMVKGKESGCLQEYDEKESKRKEKTKGSIALE